MSECNVDLCLMQMPPSIELAADDDDFEDEASRLHLLRQHVMRRQARGRAKAGHQVHRSRFRYECVCVWVGGEQKWAKKGGIWAK